MTREEAARVVQARWKRRKRMFEHIFDAETGRMYLYNKQTGETKWATEEPLPPGWTMARDPSTQRPYYYSDLGETSWTRPRPEPAWTPKNIQFTEEEAANVIIGLWRAKKARERVRRLIGFLYDKVYDEDTGQYFYYNKRTGESTWYVCPPP